MWQFLHYLFFGAFLQPNANSICRSGELCPINWNTPTNGHLQLEMKLNDTWSSVVDGEHHFLSIIVDETTQHYDWQVPWYLTTFWENPKRIVLTDMITKEQEYSDEFLVPGISFHTQITNSLYPTQQEVIEWSSNEPNGTLFGMILGNYGTVVPFILSNNETFTWNVSNYPNENVELKLLANNEQTYAYSNTFTILPATTTTTTTTTITTTTNNTNTSKDNDKFHIWLLLILIGIFIVITLIIVCIYSHCKNDILMGVGDGIGGGPNTGRVYPSDYRRKPAYQNTIYERTSQINDGNIYDCPPTLPMPVPRYAQGHYQTPSPGGKRPINSYNKLNHNQYNQLGRNKPNLPPLYMDPKSKRTEYVDYITKI